jgi:hypothetical protein
MVADPRECRIFARKATNDSMRIQFEDLAHQWQQIASDIEKFRRQTHEPSPLSWSNASVQAQTASKPMRSAVPRGTLLDHL